MDSAGQKLADRINNKLKAEQAELEKLDRHSDSAMELEISAYNAIWKKEDQFLDGTPLDDDTAAAREEIVMDIRKNFTLNLVRVASDREGVLTQLKNQGWKPPSPPMKEDIKEDDDDSVLGDDEEWEYYTDSEKEEVVVPDKEAMKEALSPDSEVAKINA